MPSLTFVSAEARLARRAANARDLVFACASRAPRPPRAPPANCFIYVRARQARSLKKSLFSSSVEQLLADTKSRLWQTFFHDLFIVALVAPPVARRVERSFRLGFPRARGEKIRASLSLSLSLSLSSSSSSSCATSTAATPRAYTRGAGPRVLPSPLPFRRARGAARFDSAYPARVSRRYPRRAG